MSTLAHARWAHVRQRETQPSWGNPTVAVSHSWSMRVEPELTPVVPSQDSRWLVTALEELRALKQAGLNMPAFGDFRIAEETLDHVRQLLTVVAVQELEKPQMMPFSGGGVSLVWNINDRELTFSVYPNDEEITFMMGAANQVAVEDGVVRYRENRELDGIVSRFLSSIAR